MRRRRIQNDKIAITRACFAIITSINTCLSKKEKKKMKNGREYNIIYVNAMRFKTRMVFFSSRPRFYFLNLLISAAHGSPGRVRG